MLHVTCSDDKERQEKEKDDKERQKKSGQPRDEVAKPRLVPVFGPLHHPSCSLSLIGLQ